MNKELEQKLIEKYKYMFAERDRSQQLLAKHTALMTKLAEARREKDEAKIAQIKEEQNKIGSYYPIAFGFEHDDGWYDLLDDLMGKIEKIDVNKTLRITQIKEKFGGLRFYTCNSPTRMDIIGVGSFETEKSADGEQISELIHETEEKSYSICEVCGKPGKLCATKGLWYKTVCLEHRKLKLWRTDTEFQEYLPVQYFGKEDEVIIPTKILCKVVKVEFRAKEDTYYYTLDDGSIRPQHELKRKPRPNLYKGWFVTNKIMPKIEHVIQSSNYDPVAGWQYTLSDNSIVKEADLDAVYDENKGIKREKNK